MTDEQQIAALREQIQQAGRNTGRTRRMLTGGLLVATVAICAYAWVTLPRRYPNDPHGLNQIAPTVALVFGVGCSLLIALPSAVLYRLRCVGAMRHVLRSLSPKKRAAVLLPLQREVCDDTRRIVAPLLNEFGLPTEAAPAAAPAARGDEASPAEEAR